MSIRSSTVGAAYGILCAMIVLAVTDVDQDAGAATTTIEGTENGTIIKWHFSDSKGNSYQWQMPIRTYENIVVESRDHVRPRVDVLFDDEPYGTLPSFNGFVKRSFTNVVDSIYDNSYGNSDFVWEVWYIVSQLTVYDKDIDEHSEGRYALETLSRGGGDCEDLAILIADMLMSSKHTDGWTFQYVFMDGDNPTDLQEMNHAILYVNDGEYDYYIEATGKPSWDWYNDGVHGWYFDVVPYTDTPDYSFMDISGYYLSNRDFSYTTFIGADLSGSLLSSTNLDGADLSYADLSGAFLDGAFLSDAILVGTNMYEAFLSGAFLFNADLYQADLSSAFLPGATLIGADLTEAILVDAFLSGADLTEAILVDANLAEANLDGATLTGADLTGAFMLDAFLDGAFLSDADLSYAYLSGAFLDGAFLSDADLTGAILSEASLRGAYLNGADLSYADLSYADLSGAYMDGADLTGADLTGTIMP